MNNSQKKPLVIIAGPTATGKTQASILLAHRINGQVISADCMQAYKYMDIGSAKITLDEMEGIKHYGVDFIEPTDEYNVTRFQSLAKESIANIYKDNAVPMIVGGTGFYIQSVLYDIAFDETSKENGIRAKLEASLKEHGPEYLHNMLAKIDPESATLIHPNNTKRVLRAIEYYEQTGQKISDHNKEQRQNKSPYNYVFFCITDERDSMYDRIDLRVDKMVNNGLIDEVKKLKDMGLSRANVSMQGIGYKEVLDYLEGKCSLDEAIYIIKRDTRHFAKRQLTWFRREPFVTWVNRSSFDSTDAMIDYMYSICKDKIL